jgi:ABC-type Na+ efflux pump permease subunit
MRKIWLVAANTYRPRVRSGTFLFLTFIMPILMIVVGAAFSIFLDHGGDLERLGYVDLTGQLAEVSQVEVEDGFLTLIRMENEGQAQAAIREDQIEGYLLIPSDFFRASRPFFTV